jgi:hypothetical protein
VVTVSWQRQNMRDTYMTRSQATTTATEHRSAMTSDPPAKPDSHCSSAANDTDQYMTAVDKARSPGTPDLSRCPYHKQVLQPRFNNYTNGLAPMSRFMIEGVSDQPALFQSQDGVGLSTSKVCTCGEGIKTREN